MSKDGRRSSGRAQWGEAEASIEQAIRELDAMGFTPHTTAIAAHTGMDVGNASRVLRKLLARGRVVRGKRVGAVVPYYLREMVE